MKLALNGYRSRYLPLLLRCCIYGAVANVIVAWGCMLWSPTPHVTVPPVPPDHSLPKLIAGPTGERGWWRVSSGFGVRVAESLGCSMAGGEPEYMRGYTGPTAPSVFDSGWPFLSMRSRVRPYHDPESVRQPLRGELPLLEILRRGPQTKELPLGGSAAKNRRLPLQPIPVGFALNAALLAALFFLTVTLARRARSRGARTRGFPIDPPPLEAGSARAS